MTKGKVLAIGAFFLNVKIQKKWKNGTYKT
jgi:hypothetical protein